jgi:hypothetical protein
MNLKQLMANQAKQPGAYFVPYYAIPFPEGLAVFVSELRSKGYRVIVAVTETETAPENCEGLVAHERGEWRLQPNTHAEGN